MFFLAVISTESRYKDYEDDKLMAAVRKDSSIAMKVLVDRYKKKAYYIALGLVGDHDEASDLSQEAFIRIYNARRNYDQSKPFFSWFYTILSNLARNHLKKRSVRSEYARQTKDAYNPKLQTPTAPDVIIESDEARTAVWEAIEGLSYDHREVIILRHFEDMSYEDIAKLVGVPVGSVMSRLYYARKKAEGAAWR
jgi:RNA polymerase sigma-70 factor (ECF subfamily)